MILQIGVKVIIRNSSNEYLFLRRRDLLATDLNETTWDIPGGRINSDESLIDGLRREVEEEVGHDMHSTPDLIAAQDIFVPSKDLHVVRLTYIIEENILEVHLSDEHEAYQWVGLNNIKSINTEPYLADVLKKLVVSVS